MFWSYYCSIIVWHLVGIVYVEILDDGSWERNLCVDIVISVLSKNNGKTLNSKQTITVMKFSLLSWTKLFGRCYIRHESKNMTNFKLTIKRQIRRFIVYALCSPLVSSGSIINTFILRFSYALFSIIFGSWCSVILA